MSCLEFGPYRVNPEERILLRNGKAIPLPPKAFDMLLMLLSRGGRVVSRDEMMQTLWPDVVVEDNNLTQNISLLRRVLGERLDGSQFIETVPKRGYRFTEKAHEVDDNPEATVTASPPLWRRALVCGATSLAILLLVFTLPRPLPRWSSAGATPTKTYSVAVLPFWNLVGDHQHDYLAREMTDDITTRLAESHAMLVVSERSASRYTNTKESTFRIARELQVDALVEGSVMLSGREFYVTAHLIDCRTDRILWAQSYVVPMSDDFGVRDAVALKIARAVGKVATARLEP